MSTAIPCKGPEFTEKSASETPVLILTAKKLSVTKKKPYKMRIRRIDRWQPVGVNRALEA